MFKTLISLSLLAAHVAAHGFVHEVWIGTKTFLGNTPNAEPTGSIVRQIDLVDPVKGADNPNLNCGQDAAFAQDIADAKPGDTMRFLWTGGDLSKWPHNIGPLMTYMTSCGSNTSDCSNFNATTAKWFKIGQVGRDSNGDWFQNRIFLEAGVTTNATLPSNILPGPYLVRHEIIALHLATSPGGAEFYPSCTQIRVSGSGTGAPAQSELVTFPGAYSDNDPGILVPNVFDVPPPSYTFPGPPVARFVAQAGSGSTPTSTATGSSSTSTTASKGKSCKLKRTGSLGTTAKRQELPRPRHLSRIMRDLAISFGGRTH